MSPVSLVYGSDRDQRAGAILSPDRTYRYVLERRWGKGPFVMFLMLNPSTADERDDDATIRRCIGFAKRWNAGGLLVGNLFAYRATHPRDLPSGHLAVGPDCDVHLQTMSLRSTAVIAAWGSQPRIGGRINEVVELLDRRLLCLGTCADGSPRHPVRLPYAVDLETWSKP